MNNLYPFRIRQGQCRMRSNGASFYRELLASPPVLAVLSGPSGCGKTTVADAYVKKKSARCSVSATTRPPRAGERHGVDYFFMSDAEFDACIRNGELAEWATMYGRHRYGTLNRTIQDAQKVGGDLLLVIDPQGGAQIRAKYPLAALILLVPPSMKALKRRLMRRGTDSEEEREARVQEALNEIQAANFYDYVIENRDGKIDEAVKALEAVMEAERRKMAARQAAFAAAASQ